MRGNRQFFRSGIAIAQHDIKIVRQEIDLENKVRFYLRLTEKDFDTLEYSEISFYVEQLVSEDRKREQQLSRQAAFITYSMGAAPPDTTYESYLTSLGLIDDSETMTKEEKQAIAMRAHDNASKVLEYYKDLEERNKAGK